MSATVGPTGDAYRAAHEVIAALGEQCPADSSAGLDPHVRQCLYGVADVDRASRALELIYHRARPFSVRQGGTGVFDIHDVLHGEVGAEPRARRAVRPDEDGQGRVRRADPRVRRWHVAAAQDPLVRRWPRRAVKVIGEASPRLDVGFWAGRVQVSRLENGRWSTIRDLPLGVPLPMAS